MKFRFRILLPFLLATCTFLASVEAKQGATDAIPGTSNGATNTKSGGTKGGGKKSSTTPAPTPAPVPQPIITKTLTFVSSSINGSTPVCTGSYHIDPYYPTLSLMTVDVETTGVGLPDGSLVYVEVSGTGGTLYPFTSNLLVLTGGAGLCSHSIYVTPGTTITAVTLRTAAGQIVGTGN